MNLLTRLAALCAGAVAVPLVVACSAARSTSVSASEELGATVLAAGHRPALPAVSGRTVTGRKLSLAADRGHVVVLNFWASWCSVCHEEAPALSAAARRFTRSGVKFVGVDVGDNAASARAFMQHYGISYPSLSDPGDLVAAEFNHLIPIADFPSTLVVSPAGRIAGRVIGAASGQDLRRLIGAAR